MTLTDPQARTTARPGQPPTLATAEGAVLYREVYGKLAGAVAAPGYDAPTCLQAGLAAARAALSIGDTLAARELYTGLESALVGLDVGERKQVVVSPSDGYGEHDPRGLQEVPRQAFPPGFEPQPGMELTDEGPQGEPVPFVVREIKPESIVIDLNHPLAGKTLHFDVTVREVRAATDDERAHGHAHGPHGHGHE